MKKAGAFLILILLAITLLPSIQAQENNLSREELIKKTNELPQREVEIPGYLEPVSRILFRFDSNPTLQDLIITLLIWLIIMFMLVAIMQAFSPFSDGVSIIVGILLSIIALFIGIPRAISSSLISIGGVFIKYPALSFFMTFVFVLLVTIPLLRFLKWSKEKREMDEAREKRIEGTKAGGVVGFMDKFAESWGETSK